MANTTLFKAVKGSLVAATLLIGSAMPAQAASFTTFSFTSAVTTQDPNPEQNDIFLDSITIGSNTVIESSDFLRVTDAAIIENANTENGPGSSDRGDNVVNAPLGENPTTQQIVDSLGGTNPDGRFNLNSIIDTENGSEVSSFNLFFDEPVNTFFIFERGLNSDLTIQAIDQTGAVIGDALELTRNLFTDTGVDIDTTEISRSQDLGSVGARFGSNIAGLRVSSGAGDNGPDFTIVATQVPEPTTVAAFGLLAGSMLLTRRRTRKA